jgi:hypothetical protein
VPDNLCQSHAAKITELVVFVTQRGVSIKLIMILPVFITATFAMPSNTELTQALAEKKAICGPQCGPDLSSNFC